MQYFKKTNTQKESKGEDPKTHICDWKYIITNWDQLRKESRHVIIRSLRIGIPEKYRGKVWALLTEAEKAKAEAGFKYSQKKNEPSKYDNIINLDVPRTFPTWIQQPSQKMMEQLRRILTAYANTDSEIGYTQGMNFIAAMFLLYQDEETAFWSFYSMMHLSSIPHREFFKNDFPKLQLAQIVIDRLIRERFPTFSKSLQEQELDSTFFAPQWVMVCFLNAGFDKKLSSFIFDQFLAYGIGPLISFGMAILELHQKYFENQGIEKMMQVLTSPGDSPEMFYKEKVNLAWNKHFINSNEYSKLQREAVLEKANSKV